MANTNGRVAVRRGGWAYLRAGPNVRGLATGESVSRIACGAPGRTLWQPLEYTSGRASTAGASAHGARCSTAAGSAF